MDDAAEKGMNQDTSGDETWQEATKRGNTAKVICSGWLGPSISFVKFFFFYPVGLASWFKKLGAGERTQKTGR